MIAEQIEQSYTSAKYYQFYTVAKILEHVIDCFHTIVSDESNPYHPPLSWLTRKQPQPPEDELFLDLFGECSKKPADSSVKHSQIRAITKSKLDRCSRELRKNIVSRTEDGCSPLFMACKLGYLNKAQYLIENCDADIEQKGHYEAPENNHVHSVPPIWVAAVSGHFEIVKLLVSHGADVNSLSDTGSTPLRSACFMSKDDDRSQGDSLEQLPFSENDNDEDIYFNIVTFLIDNGADISKANYNGGTCLINSIHNYRLTQYLLDKGVDVNARDIQSKTALHYAIQQNRLEVIKLLISYGASPHLLANDCDDALQLCCLSAHLDIFDYLIANIAYPTDRVVDAYKLLGCSILEIRYDLTRVRELWIEALNLQMDNSTNLERNKSCDKWRQKAYGDIFEFSNISELESLSVDDYRIQSLIISERILGSSHRETVQRLLNRGTSYMNSLRPDRCIDLWIYALKLRLENESIFTFESIFAAQAVTKLFLELISHNSHNVKFEDVYDVLSLLIDQLDEGKQHLRQKPVFYVHEDIFDILLGYIVYLLFVMNHTKKSCDQSKTRSLIERLIKLDSRSSTGSSLLHICVSPSIIEGIAGQCAVLASEVSSIVQLVDILVENGIDVDTINSDGLSALQTLCLTGVRISDKRPIVEKLIKCGAHLDRRTNKPEQKEAILLSLKDSGVNIMDHIKLSCLAARKLADIDCNLQNLGVAKCIKGLISIH